MAENDANPEKGTIPMQPYTTEVEKSKQNYSSRNYTQQHGIVRNSYRHDARHSSQHEAGRTTKSRNRNYPSMASMDQNWRHKPSEHDIAVPAPSAYRYEKPFMKKCAAAGFTEPPKGKIEETTPSINSDLNADAAVFVPQVVKQKKMDERKNALVKMTVLNNKHPKKSSQQYSKSGTNPNGGDEVHFKQNKGRSGTSHTKYRDGGRPSSSFNIKVDHTLATVDQKTAMISVPSHPADAQTEAQRDSVREILEQCDTSSSEIPVNISIGASEHSSVADDRNVESLKPLSFKAKKHSKPERRHKTAHPSKYWQNENTYKDVRNSGTPKPVKTNENKPEAANGKFMREKVASSNLSETIKQFDLTQAIVKESRFHGFVDEKPINPLKIESHREALIDTLFDGTYECTICCSSIHQEAPTWSCTKCFHVFHLKCIKQWANTSVVQSASMLWRCPICQQDFDHVPNFYSCFCGKSRNPVWNRNDTPHSCGDVCGKKKGVHCKHLCSELCHPGSCPLCNAFIQTYCKCKRSFQSVKCSKQSEVKCKLVCNKTKNCGVHTCNEVCHQGTCLPCQITLTLRCFCGADSKEVVCGSDTSKVKAFSCGKVCDQTLECGNHQCSSPCHAGSCLPCSLSPSVISTCPCGKKVLSDMDVPARQSCLDRIPTCGQPCNKKMSCTKETGEPHVCQRFCHQGACNCKLTSQITCRCGAKVTSLPCDQALAYNDKNPYLCERKCKKKRSCGRHTCGLPCCVLDVHNCDLICGKKLTCGLHRCEELCHRGNCPTCYQVSFDELRCTCGFSVIYPPVPCGTKPPECDQMCSRLHPCSHPVDHPCHSSPTCPPCVVLTSKSCMCGRETRDAVPCYLSDISCGLPCHQLLPCGDHKCQKICHKDSCSSINCSQPCPKPRACCGHPCMSPCHPSQECPNTECQSKVLLKCPCGERKEQVLCNMLQSKTRVSAAILTMRIKELNSSLDVAELMQCLENKGLLCDDKCLTLKRNQNWASALEIHNPDLLASLALPPFSDFLKNMARTRPQFVAQVEKILFDLVTSAKEAKKDTTRSHAFAPMKKDERQLIHELAEIYHCTSVSYDAEPQRNVMVMANKGKAQLPVQTLTSYIQYEKVPRPPLPISHLATEEQLRNKSREILQNTDCPKTDYIDYFDVTE